MFDANKELKTPQNTFVFELTSCAVDEVEIAIRTLNDSLEISKVAEIPISEIEKKIIGMTHHQSFSLEIPNPNEEEKKDEQM